MELRVTELQGNGESCIMLSYMHCIRRLIIKNQIETTEMGGHVVRMELSINAYRVLIRRLEG